VGQATATAAGQAVLLPATGPLQEGTYRLDVTSLAGAGDYHITLVVNAAVEQEDYTGLSNDAFAGAQDLDGSSLPLQGSADRLAVLGQADPGGDDHYAFTLAAGQFASLRVTPLGGDAPAVALFGPGGSPALVALGLPDGGGQSVLGFQAPVAGTYYARVHGSEAPAAGGQWASSVLGFSSQYSTGSWSAQQALGQPDTFTYGDRSTAWAPASQNGTQEYITLGFTNPVRATGVTVRETDGNGFVTRVELLDTDDVFYVAWAGTDPSLPGAPRDFTVTFPETPYLVKGVRISTDTDHDPSAWEEIDAVQLLGEPPPTATAWW
jgi:hypothetical protein